MRKMLLAASAALAALSMPVLAQDHGRGGGGGGGGGGPPDVSGGPPATIPASPNADVHASGQVSGDVHAQTDAHASDRAQTRTGADVDRSTRTDTDRADRTRDRDVTSGAGAVVKNKPAAIRLACLRDRPTGRSPSVSTCRRTTAITPN
jgi:hypothetical protein